ncbi:hypothetical protein [Paludisphaera mucosa]|uniref:PSP1 C-terminal domain-containing protein n=1 Tax=Paludisphaera mucosa TaxID=3030827 RepID=A0ABT6FAL8_9BACT|nr:hypothetical protein [Paludisphaera mucosa]MDG3004638.1 hypothetical protein [Paludisphaera mucosa]
MEAGAEAGTVGAAECLVRYGLAGRVGWFTLESGLAAPGRGEAVVIRTSRGVELGEVLTADAGRGRAGEDSVGAFRVLRRADADDFARGGEAGRLRGPRFDLCRRIVEEEGWPLELVDVEPLLDLSTVLHVLAFDELDPAPIRARFRVSCDFDVHVESPGDPPAAAEDAPAPAAGRCGDCDCGGGGCSKKKAPRTRADAAEAAPGPSPCATSSGSGCSSCGVAAWRAGGGGSAAGGVGE